VEGFSLSAATFFKVVVAADSGSQKVARIRKKVQILEPLAGDGKNPKKRYEGSEPDSGSTV
jgi:hypothetical protein